MIAVLDSFRNLFEDRGRSFGFQLVSLVGFGSTVGFFVGWRERALFVRFFFHKLIISDSEFFFEKGLRREHMVSCPSA